MKPQPSFYAVIPADVRYSGIPPNAKLLYGEITALCSKEGYCWARNKYFADLYSVRDTTISEWIRQLKDSGFIEITNQTGKNRMINLREKPKVTFGKSRSISFGKSRNAPYSITKESNTYINRGNLKKLSEMKNRTLRGSAIMR